MRKIFFMLIFFVGMSCNFETPTTFSKEVLESNLFDVKDDKVSFERILNHYKGKKILIDVWASWCADCVRGFPTIKKLQQKYPDVVFLFLSVDKNKNSWKNGISRFNLLGKHYLLENDFDSKLGDFLGLSWIPRYLVIDELGNIAMFKATKATDKNIELALQK